MTTVALTKPVPSTPTGLTYVGGVNSAVISWTASTTSTDKFQIWSSTSNDSATASLVTTIDTNSYTAALTPGQTKYYWVKTINSVGQVSGFSTYTGPATSLLGSTFNTYYLAFRGEWRGNDDGKFTNHNFGVDQIQVNINYTPSGGGSASTGWVNFTTTVTQAQAGAPGGTGWDFPNFVNASDSQLAQAIVQVPGSTWSLMCLLGDAGVPSTATVTGIQARVNGGFISSLGTTPASELKNIFQIVTGTSTTVTGRLGLAKEFTYAAAGSPPGATTTVGGTSDTWSITSPGTGVPTVPAVGVSSAPVTSSGGSSGTTTNALTINNGGAGAASGATFNGSSAVTISYNTVGAPSAGGLNATGTWPISISGGASSATNIASGAANQIHVQSGAGATTFITAPTVSSTFLQWNGTSFVWAAASGGGTTTNVLTVKNDGTGSASGTTFNGSSPLVVSYNSVGAAPLAAVSNYSTLMATSASHTAARVAGTYMFGDGDPAAITGTGTLYPVKVVYIDPADYPNIGGLTTKLRIRAVVNCNDVAPTGNYTFGLYPVTRPATSGGAGLVIYTMGTVVTGSAPASLVAPAADSQSIVVGSDFAIPAAGFYVLGMVTTAAVATSAHMHITCYLQIHNA